MLNIMLGLSSEHINYDFLSVTIPELFPNVALYSVTKRPKATLTAHTHAGWDSWFENMAKFKRV